MSHKAESTQAIAEIKEQVQFEQWKKQIEERQTAGLSIAVWCEQQGISKTTYYYRLRRVREHMCHVAGVLPESTNEHHIVPIRETVRIPAESRIEIVSGDLRISFVGEPPSSTLKAVVEALRPC
jgi:hypothetical protein